MRQQFTSAVGTDLIAIALPGGQIRGVTIDNPSGSWLQLFPSYDFVPPYTMGWARSFASGSASIDVRFADGPAGQLSTTEGDPILVVIDSEPVSDSPGRDSGKAFTQGSAGTLLATVSPRVAVSIGAGGALIPAVIGSRIRILTVSAVLGGFPAFLAGEQVSGVAWNITDAIGGSIDIAGRVTPASPTQHLVFPDGLDFPVSATAQYGASSDFADSDLGLSATYRII